MKFSGPVLTSGKFDEALQVPNTGTGDGNKLSLGRHETDCLGNVTICPDGVTVSFWIYMYYHSDEWTYPVYGPMFQIMAKPYGGSTGGTFVIGLYNGTHRWRIGQGLIYDHWHHFAFVYKEKEGFVWFFDGYRYNQITPIAEKRTSGKLELGCKRVTNCSKTKYDDLRVWNEAKDETFIWRIWQS